MKATIFSASCQTTVLLSCQLHMNKMSVRTNNKFAFILMRLAISCYLKEGCRILQEVQAEKAVNVILAHLLLHGKPITI